MLLSKGKRVAVTSTTGISCLQLGKNATTLHHWSGILDGRFSEQKLKETFLTDDLFKEAVLRIRATDCLIIDEIGMASKRTFDLVELACRLARCTNRLFGGLQVIASGDFKQLPPVANYHYCDDGSYCFESDIFKDVFPHHTNLTEVHVFFFLILKANSS
ncbi:hypothetical protein FSP39_018707 [Pinctada imbricata]|uniref:ATP-dependent DNA helicase n=1 Tax=Pinctada imbricata TaxID=66713 RepID=A0AA88YNZ5_PINIB|nr:hypothetical protein FSP39_018707 [Pinctada imbricata]